MTDPCEKNFFRIKNKNWQSQSFIYLIMMATPSRRIQPSPKWVYVNGFLRRLL